MSIASAISAAQARVAAAYTACDDKGATMPATQNLANLPDTIDSIPSGGGETWRTWTRPQEWPQYTDAMIASAEVMYLTYDCRGAKAGSKREYVGFNVQGAYVVERGSLTNGVFTAVTTTAKTSGSQFAETLPTDEGDYVVYRITPASGAHITKFNFSASSVSGYSTVQPWNVQSCIERFASLPYIAGNSNNQWACDALISDTVKGLTTALNGSMQNAYLQPKKMEHCTLEGTVAATSFHAMFNGCTALYDLDLSKFYVTSAATNFTSMFASCAMQYLNLGNGLWDMSGATILDSMFQGCKALQKIDGIGGWTLSSVTTMKNMFNACQSLISIDSANWTTSSSLTNLNNAFTGCMALIEVDLSSMNVSGVTNFGGAFYNCSVLTKADLSSWVMTSATTLNTMFRYCYALEEVIFGANGLQTSSALTDMYALFDSCRSLNSVNLSGVVSSGVTDFRNVFNDCKRLQEVNISNFNFSAQTTSDRDTAFFYNCNNLRTLSLPSSGMWQIGSAMFRYCHFIEKIVFPSNVTSILANACANMTSALLFDFRNATGVPSLANANAFNTGNNTQAKIVVPDALYSSWIAATNWSSLASQIVSASDYTD